MKPCEKDGLSMLILMIRTLILYSAVILSLRIMGKRQIGELQPSELVVAIMISDMASVPMQSIDIPLLSGIVPVLTLIVAEVAMSYLGLRSRRLRRLISGEPSIIIYDGKIDRKELEKLRFNINDLLEELRANNCYNVADVEVAVLETNGALSVIPKDSARAATVEDLKIKNPARGGLPYTLITDGEIDKKELLRSGKTEKWLLENLKKQGIDRVEQVFIASLDDNGKFFIQKKFEGES